MITQELTIFVITFLIVLAIAFFPRIALRKQILLTSEEISNHCPNLRGVKYKYNIPIIISIPVLFFLLISVASRPEKLPVDWVIMFPFIFFLFIGLYEGLFAVITRVFPMTTRWNWNQFVYDRHDRYRWMAKLQVLLTAIGLLLCLVIFLL